MSTYDDLRDLRDALDSIVHGALPRWSKPTTQVGAEAQRAAIDMYERFVRALKVRVGHMMESMSMACEEPPSGCQCAGCSYSREKAGDHG